MAKDRCSACDHPTVSQAQGDEVCINPDCEDYTTADPVTSCCLEEAEDGACPVCGTPVSFVLLSKTEADCLSVAADVLCGDARDLSPSAGAEAWEGLRSLLRRLGVDPEDLPNPTEA